MRRAIALAVALVALLAAAPAGAAPGASEALLVALPAQYGQAVVAHDETLATRLRIEAGLLARVAPSPALARLGATLRATRDELQPWPTTAQIARLTAAGRRPAVRAQDPAVAAALATYARAGALARRLRSGAAGGLDAAFWSPSPRAPGLLVALARRLPAHDVAQARERVEAALRSAEQAAGDVHVSRATVVTDAAILVFREGLEAVLILAAITASFVGSRRHLRRPVLLGGLAGIAASIVTWFVAQFVIDELGTGGLRLEAITGLLAIAVLLVVTNWFFHRVYWSQWIARFNRRRKHLERLDRLGFLSGQVVGLALLGLTSVYREGFETVLFLQNLQVSAGTGACVLGAGIGMAGVLAVGGLTFAAQRKLPYRRMLIATGILIAVVLAVMTGTTVHVMQGLGWVPSTPTSFAVPLWASRWLGIYPTWEGIAAQLGALVVVVGSYVAAREIQVRGPRRRAVARSGATRPPAPAP